MVLLSSLYVAVKSVLLAAVLQVAQYFAITLTRARFAIIHFRIDIPGFFRFEGATIR